MGFLLKPGFLATAKSASDVQKLMKADLKNNAGKSGVKFVAAKNVVIGGKTCHLFIVTDTPELFDKALKASQPKALRAKGTCDLEKEGGITKVTIKTSSGQMLPDGIAKLLPLAVANDAAFKADHLKPGAADPLAANPLAAKAAEMARKSIAQAKLEGKLEQDYAPDTRDEQGRVKQNVELTDSVIKQITKVGLESAEYKKFAEAYEALADEYEFNQVANYKKVPVNIWHDLIKGMAESGYITKNIPKVGGDPYKLIFASKEPGGRMVREELLKRAMEGMEVYTRHAAANLDKVVKNVLKKGGDTWAFWSGEGAKDAAKKEAGSGVVLEGSIGSWFDKVWKFEHLTGVNDMLLWNSMSELYARKAAQYYQQFKFIGFIGPGGSRETTVFVNIERPTLIQVLNVQKQVAVPPIRWMVVDCVADPSSRTGWKGTGNPSKEFPNRVAALAEVVRRYKE